MSVAVKWRGTGRPTMLHIHEGAKGTNGGVKIDFGPRPRQDANPKDANPQGREPQGHQPQGNQAPQQPHRHRHRQGQCPAGPAEGGSGCVLRQSAHGRVPRWSRPRPAPPGDDTFGFGDALDSFQASVVRGRQIYECKKDPATGAFAFAQRDVRAVLGGRIAHSFTAPNSGTPQWVAPDRSAVTGAVSRQDAERRREHPRAGPEGDAVGRAARPAGRHRGDPPPQHRGRRGPFRQLRRGRPRGRAPTGRDYVFVQR